MNWQVAYDILLGLVVGWCGRGLLRSRAVEVITRILGALAEKPDQTALQISGSIGGRFVGAHLSALERAGVITSRLIVDAAGQRIRTYRLAIRVRG